MQRHADTLSVQTWPTSSPVVPSDPIELLDFHYYWNFFLSLPFYYRLGLICLAGLLYYAIRRQYQGR